MTKERVLERTDEPAPTSRVEQPRQSAKEIAQSRKAAFLASLNDDGSPRPIPQSSHRRGEEPEARRTARMELERRHKLPPRPKNPNEYRYLIDCPADPQHVDWRNPKEWFRTRLHKAAIAGNLHEVRSLIGDRDANPFVRDSSGHTPCFVANGEGHEETAEYLHQVMSRMERVWNEYKLEHGKRRVRSRSKRYTRDAHSKSS